MLKLSELRAAWRTESGELFFNIQLPSASHRFPTLPSVLFFVFFFLISLNLWDLYVSFLQVPSSFSFLVRLSAYFLQLPSASFSLPQLPSASFNFLQLSSASIPSASLPWASFGFLQLPSADIIIALNFLN